MVKEELRQRFDAVSSAIFSGPPVASPAKVGNITNQDCMQLADGSVIRKADLKVKTRSVGVGFTVLEEKDGKLRRRFIFWDKAANRWYRSAVGSEIKLGHIADHLPHVQFDVGTVRDGEGGFLGIALPEEACAAYRFYDTSGQLWEMLCLPVGISGAPELCQTVFGAIAGHKDYAAPEHLLRTQHPAAIVVHIDDIGVRHAAADTAYIEQFYRQRELDTGVRFKPTDTTGVPRYVFLGLLWDHEARAVGLAEKFIRKLEDAKQELLAETLTFAGLESLTGRLIYGTCALGHLLAVRYLTMKSIRRVLRAADLPTAVAPVSDALVAQLLSWIDGLSVRRMHPVRLRRAAWLFTDASTKGWGAILVTASGKTFVVGKSWRHTHKSGDISYLEALALSCAVSTLRQTLQREMIGVLHVIVDNTSVEAGVRRGLARSVTVNEGLLYGLLELKDLPVSVTVRYIKSGDNPADSVSRGDPVNLRRLSDVVGATMRQGGRASRAFLPHPTMTQSKSRVKVFCCAAG
jgi:hypothetical protein